jgi:hypothetical protein
MDTQTDISASETARARYAYTAALAVTAVLVSGAIALAYANGGALILDIANSAATFFCL